MRWRVLGPVLGLILLGALLFSFWPASAPELPPPEPRVAPTAPVAAAPPGPPNRAEAPRPPAPPPAPVVAAPAAVPPPAPPERTEQLDPEPDWQHLKALGLTEADIEPLDGGPLFALTRDGIKAAVTEGLPEIRECYEGWLQQNPSLSGKMKVQFNIAEIPGRDRAKVMRVEIADGGMGHIAMEGCVRNVFKNMRFEAPKGGELNVTYPLSFESKSDTL